MKPKVTVTMPAYNAERFIGEAIESVLEQDYNDFELLILDDVFHAEDLNFMHKYLNYLKVFRSEGGTTILTSHNLELLSNLCQRGLYLDKGKQIIVSDIGSVIDEYKKAMN